LSLDDYFESIDKLLNHPLIQSTDYQKEKRSSNVGLIYGKIVFIDFSKLYFMEYLEVDLEVNKKTFSYHYQDKNQLLIFRYDNAPHYPNIRTFPFHKHVKAEVNESKITDLSIVLSEIFKEYLIK
jgi:hypothetical protein